MQTTIDFFKKAIEVDPQYALAHAQLAFAYIWTALFIETADPKWADLARSKIKRSQELGPNLAETHVAHALLLWSDRFTVLPSDEMGVDSTRFRDQTETSDQEEL